MRVLLLTQVLPYPPDSGPKIKTYHLLQHLASQHEVTLVSLIRSADDLGHAATLRNLGIEVHTVPLVRARVRDVYYLARSLVTNQSFIIERDASAALHRLLADLCARSFYDIIHVDQLNMAQFALGLRCGACVLDQHNAVWAIPQRMGSTLGLGPRRAFLDLEARRLRRYEAEVCRRMDAVLVVSEADRWALELALAEQGQGAPVSFDIVPIAVDTQTEPVITRATEPRSILSLGTMFWPPNVDGVLWFAHEVYPLVKAQVPDVHFAVVGARPPQSVSALAEGDSSIEVTGYVTDPKPYLEQSAALIVPLHAGGGMRVKILEALARGIPIVSTTIGYEGIDLTPGEHLLVADTPSAFAAAVVQLLRSPAFGRQLAAQGRALAEQRYEWRIVYRQIDYVYDRLAEQIARRRASAEGPTVSVTP